MTYTVSGGALNSTHSLTVQTDKSKWRRLFQLNDAVTEQLTGVGV